MDKIENLNANANDTAIYDLNELSDFSDDEFENLRGLRIPENRKLDAEEKDKNDDEDDHPMLGATTIVPGLPVATILPPVSKDYRTQAGILTPVKN